MLSSVIGSIGSMGLESSMLISGACSREGAEVAAASLPPDITLPISAGGIDVISLALSS
jgi:hypothetical protein